MNIRQLILELKKLDPHLMVYIHDGNELSTTVKGVRIVDTKDRLKSDFEPGDVPLTNRFVEFIP